MSPRDEDTVEVRFLGGPEDWRGHVERYPRSDVFGEDPGAWVISDHPPPRDMATEDIDPRAVYEPDEGGDPTVWIFRGWSPPGAGDPPPGWYG